ncbi:MAG: cupredoxin domain-containing protein [Nitrospirae bacterium]|nr:cupredoxin domain-containing protein [Nitrospirota bacterium]
MTRRSSVVMSVLVAAVIGLIGWAGLGTAVAEMVKISMKDRQFSPATLTVKVGEPVEWLNDDQDVHQVISGKGLQDPSLGKPLDSGTLLPGQYFIHTFTKPGKYPYMCVIHWSLQSITGQGGMIGEVIVEP